MKTSDFDFAFAFAAGLASLYASSLLPRADHHALLSPPLLGLQVLLSPAWTRAMGTNELGFVRTGAAGAAPA